MVLSAVATSVPFVRAAVAVHFGDGGRDPVTCVSALLCVTEMTSNVVVHAYPDDPGDFEVRVRSDGDRVELRVADCGIGFPDPPGTGLGLEIVRTLSDSFTVERVDGSTLVTARLQLTG